MNTDKARIEEHSLPVNLTQDEMIAYSKELAKHTQDLRDKENRKKEMSKMMDAEISGHKTHIDLLSMKIGNGYEYRNIECCWKFDLENSKKTLIRNDTFEVVKTDTLTSQDLQKKLM